MGLALEAFLVSDTEAAPHAFKVAHIVRAALRIIGEIILIGQILYSHCEYPAKRCPIGAYIDSGIAVKFIDGYIVAVFNIAVKQIVNLQARV